MADLDCLVRAQEGDLCARDEVFNENTGLIYMVIKRFSGRGYDSDELFQIGSIGLLKAIERFDTTSDYAFSTYAVPMIIGEIRRFLRDDNMVHISRKIKEDARKIAIVREQEQKQHNRSLTVDEVQKLKALSVKLAVELFRELREFNSGEIDVILQRKDIAGTGLCRNLLDEALELFLVTDFRIEIRLERSNNF